MLSFSSSLHVPFRPHIVKECQGSCPRYLILFSPFRMRFSFPSLCVYDRYQTDSESKGVTGDALFISCLQMHILYVLLLKLLPPLYWNKVSSPNMLRCTISCWWLFWLRFISYGNGKRSFSPGALAVQQGISIRNPWCQIPVIPSFAAADGISQAH